MPMNPVAAKAGGLVTEMYICEVGPRHSQPRSALCFPGPRVLRRVLETRGVRPGLCASDGGKGSPLEQWQEKWRRPW